MNHHYPGREVKQVGNFSNNPSYAVRSIEDVLSAFKSLPRYGSFIAVSENGLIENSKAYTGINNHFQGIQRLNDGQHFVLSGGNINDQHAHLFIGKLSYFGIDKSYPRKKIPISIRTGPVGSNVILKEKIPGTDVLKDIICLETGKFWHAGGIAMIGDILAVPLENRRDKTSVIGFYNLKSLRKIERLNNLLVRNTGKCGAVAMTKLSNDHILCVSWSDDDDLPNRFEFYYSNHKNDLTIFANPETVKYDQVINKSNGKSRFQAIQIIKQSDGKLFLLATQNANKLTPRLRGSNEALLFEITLDMNSRKSKSKRLNPRVKFILKKRFANGGSYFNFAAAAGVYIDKKGELALYSGSHWRSKGAVRFTEFYSTGKSKTNKIENISDARIELYEDKNFKKRNLIIYGTRFARLKKYDHVFVHGSYFDDKISSIRYLLPEGIKYRLYDDDNFNNSDKGKNHLTLTGTGYVEEIKNLKTKTTTGLKYRRIFDDKCSSSSFVK